MPADVDRVPFWFASFLPFFGPARTVPAQGCVSGQPLNRSLAMALAAVELSRVMGNGLDAKHAFAF